MHRIKGYADYISTSCFSTDNNIEGEEIEQPCLHQKEQIDSKKKEFVQSFTVHGLSRIFTGSRTESIFWSTIVLFGIAISSFVIYGLVCKYYRYEIYTEVSAKVTNENTFPSITFCDHNFMRDNYFAYCGVPLGQTHENINSSCLKKIKDSPDIKNIIKTKNGGWSNGLFHVRKCDTWGSKLCANDKYLKSLRKHNHSCFTWNWNGDLYDPYSHAYIEFEINKTAERKFSYMVASVHDPGVTELELTNRVFLEPSKTYQLQIKQTVLKRLPNPFPSNCTYSMSQVIFPGKYTRRTCIESLNYIEMLKHCGDTLDYPKKFIPNDLVIKYERNNSIAKTWGCMIMFSKLEVTGVSECPVPCVELELSVMSSYHELDRNKDDNKTVYRIDIQYMNVDSYRIIEEKQLYSWDQIAGEVGGFIGLVIGASFISIIEIILYLILCFF